MNSAKLYQNPVIPGFHPDPSVCRPPVRDDFAAPELALTWNFVRANDPSTWSLSERTGNGQACSGPADFDWFDYEVLPDQGAS